MPDEVTQPWMKVLAAAAGLGESPAAEIAEYVELPRQTVEAALRWAAALGAVREAGGRWQIEPFASRCLTAETV